MSSFNSLLTKYTSMYPFKGIYTKGTTLSPDVSSVGEMLHFLANKFITKFENIDIGQNCVYIGISNVKVFIYINRIEPSPNRVIYKSEDFEFIDASERDEVVDKLNEEESMSHYEVYICVYENGHLYDVSNNSGYNYSDLCKVTHKDVLLILQKITEDFGGDEYQEPLQRII